MENQNCSSCYGCYRCFRCSSCYGCSSCYSCYGCYSCYSCYSCSSCSSCYSCKATYKSLFSFDQFGAKFMLFNVQKTEKEIDILKNKLYELQNGWYPKQTNAFELYFQNGNDWSKIDPQKLTCKNWDISWVDMPKAAIDYLKSLPEFDADIFKKITGIDVRKDKDVEEAIKLLQNKGMIKDGKIINL